MKIKLPLLLSVPLFLLPSCEANGLGKSAKRILVDAVGLGGVKVPSADEHSTIVLTYNSDSDLFEAKDTYYYSYGDTVNNTLVMNFTYIQFKYGQFKKTATMYSSEMFKYNNAVKYNNTCSVDSFTLGACPNFTSIAVNVAPSAANESGYENTSQLENTVKSDAKALQNYLKYLSNKCTLW